MINLTREQKIYLALWRKAGQSDKTVEVKLASYNDALAMRLAMYRTIKPFRAETTDSLDEELRIAGERFTLSVPKGQPVLIIKPRNTLTAAEQAMADLGISEEDLMSPEERRAMKAMEAELEGLIPTEKPVSANKFYSREN